MFAKLGILSIAILGACVDTPDPSQDAAVNQRPLVSGDVLDLSWSLGSNTACEGCTQRWEVDCGQTVSHPCPYLHYTTTMSITDDSVIFGDAVGGFDDNGIPVQNHLPWTDVLTRYSDTAIVLAQRGDDAGLRHEARMKQRADGVYESNIEWTLFNEAGFTTFHVEARFR